MLCADFRLCAMTYTGMDVSWNTFSQPAGDAWAFSCTVDLRMTSDDAGSAFNKLDPEIQKQIKSDFQDEDAFSVQQLLFDLNNAGLQTVPTMQILKGKNVLDPTVVGKINGTFLGSYFADMHARGQPLLHVSVVSNKKDESEFRATDMTLQACQLLDDSTHKPFVNPTRAIQEMSTMNYLCMSQNHPMPTLTRPSWNWLTEAENRQYDGVIACSRNVFAMMLKDQLQPLLLENCYVATAKCWLNAGSIPQYDVDIARLSDEGQTGTPTFSMTTAPNPMVMQWTWNQESSQDSNNIGVVFGSLDLRPSYTCQVTFSGNQVIIDQNIKVYLKLMKEQNTEDGNVVDLKMTEKFDLKVDNGKVVTELAPKVVVTDNSETPTSNWFMNAFNQINDEISAIKNKCTAMTTNFSPAPISAVQRFQFPGGKTFAFCSFQFSNNQDLTSAITYVDPTQ